MSAGMSTQFLSWQASVRFNSDTISQPQLFDEPDCLRSAANVMHPKDIGALAGTVG